MLRRILPAALSLANASMGALAIWTALKLYPLHVTFSLILLGILLDGLDGFAARLFRVEGRGGALLDSLCDIVTFSLAPSALIYVHLYRPGSVSFHSFHNALVVTATYLLFIFSLYRLIRYYREYGEKGMKGDFAGLPAPACALFVTSLLAVMESAEASLPVETLYLTAVVLVAPFMATRVGYPRPGNGGRLLFVAATAAYLATPTSQKIYPAAALLLLSVLYLLSPLLVRARGWPCPLPFLKTATKRGR